MRMTRARKLILEALKSSETHPTADEIFLWLRTRLPRVSLATVYRNLEVLERNGLVRKLELSSGRRHYDGNPVDHAHIRCVKCGSVADIPLPGRGWWQKVRRVSNYELLASNIELVGICKRCMRGKKVSQGR